MVDDGRLFWIQDAYTTGERFPYADITVSGVSYIRNSVKIVVDAYEGDDLVRRRPAGSGAARLSSGLPAPVSADPGDAGGLVAHLRYPQDLFAIQAQKYATYHMTEPHVFYNSESLAEPARNSERLAGAVGPEYVLIRMPGEPRLDSSADANDPRRARQHDRLARGAFGAAPLRPTRRLHPAQGPAGPGTSSDRCNDRPGHHDLASAHALGPAWLTVIRGHLLVIPIDKAFLYVEPVYLRAQDTRSPSCSGHRQRRRPSRHGTDAARRT